MAHETAGDPVRGLKWTRRMTAKIAAQLRTLGIDVCARTVARLLKAMGFSLRVNHKKLAGASHPNRNDQFEHITALRERCAPGVTVAHYPTAASKWNPIEHRLFCEISKNWAGRRDARWTASRPSSNTCAPHAQRPGCACARIGSRRSTRPASRSPTHKCGNYAGCGSSS